MLNEIDNWCILAPEECRLAATPAKLASQIGSESPCLPSQKSLEKLEKPKKRTEAARKAKKPSKQHGPKLVIDE